MLKKDSDGVDVFILCWLSILTAFMFDTKKMFGFRLIFFGFAIIFGGILMYMLIKELIKDVKAKKDQ